MIDDEERELPEGVRILQPDDDLGGKPAKDHITDDAVPEPSADDEPRHRARVDQERQTGHPAHAVREEYRARGERVGPRVKGDPEED